MTSPGHVRRVECVYLLGNACTSVLFLDHLLSFWFAKAAAPYVHAFAFIVLTVTCHSAFGPSRRHAINVHVLLSVVYIALWMPSSSLPFYLFDP